MWILPKYPRFKKNYLPTINFPADKIWNTSRVIHFSKLTSVTEHRGVSHYFAGTHQLLQRLFPVHLPCSTKTNSRFRTLESSYESVACPSRRLTSNTAKSRANQVVESNPSNENFNPFLLKEETKLLYKGETSTKNDRIIITQTRLGNSKQRQFLLISLRLGAVCLHKEKVHNVIFFREKS